MMQVELGKDVQEAVEMEVRIRIGRSAVLDVGAAAQDIKRSFADRDIPVAAIAASVARFATRCGQPVERLPVGDGTP